MKTNLVISLLGAFQGILLSLFFFVKSRKNIANLMMGIYVFVFSVGLIENWLAGVAGDSIILNILLALVSNSAFLYGPLLYLFVYYLTENQTGFLNKHYIHFSLFALAFLARVATILWGNRSNEPGDDGLAGLIAFEIFVVQVLTYNIVAIKRLNSYYKNILDTYSNIEEKDLGWLRMLLIIVTGIYAFSFLLTHLQAFGIGEVQQYFIVVQLSITIFIYLMSYMVLFRSKLFIPSLKNEEPTNLTNEISALTSVGGNGNAETGGKYRKSGLKPEQASRYLVHLKAMMENEKPFKNSELNIYGLSQMLGISRNHLTQVLNEELKQSFFEFINEHRVREAQELMLNPAYMHMNLPGIAIESGYKSKTTFFSNFKKITGDSPQEWLKKRQNEFKLSG